MGFSYQSILHLVSMVLLVFSNQANATPQLKQQQQQQQYYNESALLRGRNRCNLFQGKWVFDPSYPFYDSSKCPFIDPEFDCLKYGRPDKQFLKYAWKPDACTLPRWDYMRDERGLYKDMNRLQAYYKGLATWANWVDTNVDPTKTTVFFQGISPTHYEGREWNQPKRSCNGELQPLSGSKYPGGAPPAAAVLNKILGSMKKPVYLLDITTLSQLRKDAHPSTYGGQHSGNDCSHWCLPGLPDSWNQLLYAALVM
ncbi:hypothetical protein V6N11_046311 [Hibiscus sabdariffa]|uniref:Trichome birefringence-like C-terminal domain-containing protein n=1 Tax=Hibiscus sabdariffa TaxID=183260 RepID=A0ABR1ZWW8_9ROSI